MITTKRYIRTLAGYVGETVPANIVTDIETAYALGGCCENDFQVGQIIVTTESTPAFMFMVTSQTSSAINLSTVTVV